MANFKDLDALLQKYVDDGLPSCSCVIAKKGEILYENYFGYADIENKIPLTRENVFRQASLTKIAMYTTAMILYERGKFLMTDPIYEYFPEWRHSKKAVVKPNGDVEIVPTEHPITIKNVMNMTCGLPYHMILGGIPVRNPTANAMGEAMKPLLEKGYYTLREQIKAMAEVPLAFEPGTRWLYGFASELTAGLLEAIGGKPAELVIKETLFEPLGMENSANFTFGDIPQRLVKDYVLNRGKNLGDEDALSIVPADREAKMVGPLGTVPGFSRVITNCYDYTKLMQMLANGGVYNGERIMGRKTIDLMRCNTISQELIDRDFSNSYLAGYGYGYGVRTLMDKYVGHHNGSLGQFGWTGGSGTWAEADPSEGVSIVYMHNLQPNLEEYHHLRMRAVAYGCME
ncbi:MAG: serine hydrolase [Clostridia bacterium]|nr:serine hydrolase [Clostridia bacterium]